MILKGVVSRCDVGLMSLFEHYKSCQVSVRDGNIMILKGVVSRCDVGLLSLFEHYKSCQVSVRGRQYYDTQGCSVKM